MKNLLLLVFFAFVPWIMGQEDAETLKPHLQIINASAGPVNVLWLKPDGSRAPAGTVKPGKTIKIKTTIGHRFVIVAEDKQETPVTCEVPIQAVRFDPDGKNGVPAFYTQSASAHGFPIVASAKVNPYALREAAYILDMMLSQRPDVREAMIKSGARMCIMAHDEFTTDLPEFARFKTEPVKDFPGVSPQIYWDTRARGMGGSQDDPFCTCAEENVLGFPGDPYEKECILIHEFAHAIHLRGMVNVDPTFDARLKAAYTAAMKAGLWKGKYPSVNHHEYFAEGVQSWFDNNRENDHDHNHVNTRAELLAYDPGLAAICREVFGDTVIKYTKPATRLTGHMAGYDPARAPVFVWPERLVGMRAKIKARAEERNRYANSCEQRSVSGWTVYVSKELLASEATATAHALDLLKGMLDEITRVVPPRALAKLQEVPLYFSPEYPNARPRAEYHPGESWLRDQGRDPAMVRGVEFTNIRSFDAEMRRMPNFALHELAHSYHDRVLGFDEPRIKAAYEHAKASGKYDKVERQNAEGHKHIACAYAMTNPQEYFAECTESFFSRNDFFPYSKEQLKQHDPEIFALLDQVWGTSPSK